MHALKQTQPSGVLVDEGSRVDRYRKARTVERVLFTILLVALAGGGFLYGWFRSEVSDWLLVALIVLGMCVCYLAYRFALNFALRKLAP